MKRLNLHHKRQGKPTGLTATHNSMQNSMHPNNTMPNNTLPNNTSPQIEAIPTLIEDPYIRDVHRSTRTAPMHNHRRLQSWGLSEFTSRQKAPKNDQNNQKSPIVASSNASLEAVLPEYRKLKSAYRKKYAAHLQPKPQTQKTETTVVNHDEEGKRRAREWSNRAMGGNRAMDAYTVGVSSSSSFSPPPPSPSAVDPRIQTRVLPVPQRYLSQPPPPSTTASTTSSTTSSTTPTTTPVHESPMHKRRQRQRRVSILSTQEKKKILLKTREIEKEKSKQNLKVLKQQKQAELLAASQPTKDLAYLEGYENIAKEEYDTMIHDLDNRLDTHVKVIRQRRASYNVVKANVPTMTGTSNEKE